MTAREVTAGPTHLRDDALIRAEDLVVEFPAGRKRVVQAVSGVSFDVAEGETLGLVGESGCGKSTTGRSLVQLPRPTSGRVMFDGVEISRLSGEDLRRVRPALQLIYQDPIASLHPQMTVEQILTDPLIAWKRGDRASRREVAAEKLRAVGMDPTAVMRRPAREFSGGQCQRLCIARALVLDPKALILDEPVSALDVSVQAQILNLLESTKEAFGLTMVFISHDLAVVRHVSDRLAVMYLGKVCEIGRTESIYDAPAHPYTDGLLASVPQPKGARAERQRLTGEIPSPLDPPSGCRFRTRCPRAEEVCAHEEPPMRPVSGADDRYVACHFPLVDAGDPVAVKAPMVRRGPVEVTT